MKSFFLEKIYFLKIRLFHRFMTGQRFRDWHAWYVKWYMGKE